MTRGSPDASRKSAVLARRSTAAMRAPFRALSSRGLETRRSTSVLARRAALTRCPISRGASWRTIVSTSGSSGTADLPPGDVMAILLSLKIDPGARCSAAARGGSHRRAQSRDVKHSTAVYPQHAIGVAGSTCVEDQYVGAQVLRHPDRGPHLRR